MDFKIEQAIKLGADLIITHEPTFYSHMDQTDWLKDDSVYQAKRRMIDENHIAIWRFHDYWHSHKPDGVLMGVLTKLGWQGYYNPENSRIIVHPGISLGDIASHAKKSLGIRQVRIIGDRKQICKLQNCS